MRYTYSLVIKADTFDAALAAAKARLPSDVLLMPGARLRDGAHTLMVDSGADMVHALNVWYTSAPNHAPFPADTLLFWTKVEA